MVFKNEKELERFILKKSRLALMKSQDKIYNIIKKFLYMFYNDYKPGVTVEPDGSKKYSPWAYDRTYQLLQSLVQSRIVSDGKGYKVEVYFDYNSLKYLDGNQPSGLQVMEAASQGLHGAIGDDFLYVHGDKGIGIWDGGSKNPIQILDAKAIEILKNMLIAEGIPIK